MTNADHNDKWEDGTLGENEATAQTAPEEFGKAVDEALGLHLISIRLPKALIDQLKMLAKIHGIGYQPMVRDVLTRFARFELKSMMEAVDKPAKASLTDAESPAAKYFEPERMAATG